MKSKEELKSLIEMIKDATGLSQQDIAVQAGYQPKSLTQILSKGEGLEATYRQLQLVFKERLNKSTKQVGVETEKAQAVTPAPLNTDPPVENMVPLSTLYNMLKEHYDDMKATKNQMLANNALLTNTNTVLVNTVASLQEDIKAVRVDLDEMTTHFSGLVNVLLLNQETMLRHVGLPVAPYERADTAGTQSSSLHVSGLKGSIKSDSGTVGK